MNNSFIILLEDLKDKVELAFESGDLLKSKAAIIGAIDTIIDYLNRKDLS